MSTYSIYRRIADNSESLPPTVTTTTTTRKITKVLPEDEEGFSRETIVRRQDQKIKDDITNKLYRIEMDRIKPSFDVHLQTAPFRSSRIRTRTITPEPVLRHAPRAHSVDVRRYSTAGNLDIYRPNIDQYRYGFERPASSQVIEYVSSNKALVPYGWKGHEVVERIPNNDLLTEFELRKLAELRVKGKAANSTPNGHLMKTEVVRYAPMITYHEVPSSPVLYRGTTDVSTALSHQPVNHAKRIASDGHYELDQFEKLMHRNFGAGGLNTNKTLLYTSPPYASAYEPYVSPYAYSSRYTTRPYYSGSYTYSYPTHSRPYYYSSYSPYTYYHQRPAEYESIYSPPSRVTAPGGYYPRYYYGTGYYGGYYPPTRYYTYTY